MTDLLRNWFWHWSTAHKVIGYHTIIHWRKMDQEQMLDQHNNKHAQALSWASLPLHTDKTVWTHFESQFVICKKLYWLRNLEVTSPTLYCSSILKHWTTSRTDPCHCFPHENICPLALIMQGHFHQMDGCADSFHSCWNPSTWWNLSMVTWRSAFNWKWSIKSEFLFGPVWS